MISRRTLLGFVAALPALPVAPGAVHPGAGDSRLVFSTTAGRGGWPRSRVMIACRSPYQIVGGVVVIAPARVLPMRRAG